MVPIAHPTIEIGTRGFTEWDAFCTLWQGSSPCCAGI
jgi:hypothetical protein